MSFSLLLASPLSLAVPAMGQKIMIAGPSPYAIEAGKEIAHLGGNAVDVIVAACLALSVTGPYYASLGGGGFALIHMNGETQAIDFRETAPGATYPAIFTETAAKSGGPKVVTTPEKNSAGPKSYEAPTLSTDGGLAVGVPGIPAGLWAIHKKYGHLKWSQVIAPAIRLAEKGFNVSGEWHTNTEENAPRFNSAGQKYFLKSYLHAMGPGDVLVQKQLAEVLRKISDKGPDAFYQGPVAKDLVDTVQGTGGVLTLADLKNYQVRWLKPLVADFGGRRIELMPPPSSGGVVIKTALHLIEDLDIKSKKPLSIDEFHLLAETLKLAFLGRSQLGDPDFNKNPVEHLTSSEYAKNLAQKVTLEHALTTEQMKKIEKESTQTTHISVIDADGNAIAMTVTLNGTYGSGVVSEKYGIALNNEMDDFTTQPDKSNMFGLIQGKANQVAPGKRPLSSMSPTLVIDKDDGKAVMAIGAPGGPRIISAVVQGLYRTLVTGWNADISAQAPRVHHQYWPNTLFVDGHRFSPEILEGLEKRGHHIEESYMAKLYIVKKNDKGYLEGGFDSRGEGAAGGF